MGVIISKKKTKTNIEEIDTILPLQSKTNTELINTTSNLDNILPIQSRTITYPIDNTLHKTYTNNKAYSYNDIIKKYSGKLEKY